MPSKCRRIRGINYEIDARDTTNAVCDAACTTARDISAQAIALTKYGQTARLMSKFRPVQPVIAATPVQKYLQSAGAFLGCISGYGQIPIQL